MFYRNILFWAISETVMTNKMLQLLSRIIISTHIYWKEKKILTAAYYPQTNLSFDSYTRTHVPRFPVYVIDRQYK